MATVYCRCCLIKDVRMVEVDRAVLNDECMRLTGFVISNPLLSICYECAAKFKNYVNFRNKCLRANTLLLEILNKNNNMLTIEELQNIDRHYYKLESHFITRSLEKTSFDEDTKTPLTTDYFITIKKEEEAEETKTFDVEKIKKLGVSDTESLDRDGDYSDGDDKDEDYDEFKDFFKPKKSSVQRKLKKIKVSKNKVKKENSYERNNLSEDDFTPIENYFCSKKRKNRGQKVKNKNGIKIKSITFDTQINDADLGVKPKTAKIREQTDFDLDAFDEDGYTTTDDFNLIENYFSGRHKDKEIDVQVVQNSDVIQFDEEPKKMKELIEKNIGIMVSNVLQDDNLSNVFNIVALTPEMSRQEVLLRKETNNYKNSKYKCNMCFRGFLADTTYKNHMKKHTDECGKWECEYCHMRAKSRRQLRKHYQTHKNKFICIICPQVFFDRSAAVSHVDLHKGVKYNCDECDRTFNLQYCLSKHKRIHHSHTCVCEMCGSTFNNLQALSLHKSLLHKQEINQKLGGNCTECDLDFSTELAWKRHVVLRHNVSNGCDICGEIYTTASDLRSHKKTHIGKEIINLQYCKLCGMQLPSKTEYNKHMRAAHPTVPIEAAPRSSSTTYICDQCGATFKNKSMFRYHQNRHTGHKPFKCQICGKCYSSPTNLYIHRKTHQSQRARCHLCPKIYKSVEQLKKHIKMSHLNIRPYECELCGKAFTFPHQVRSHIKYVHDKEPWPKRQEKKKYY